MQKLKVLIIDDSALIRSVMTEIVNSQPDMEVVGTAPDPLSAREMIKQTNPDVLTLDVEMPRMNGLEFLEKLMRLRPTPVVMVSTLTEAGSEAALKALELGAVDFVAKPRLGVRNNMNELTREIADKIRAAARAHIQRREANTAPIETPKPLSGQPLSSTDKIVFIGSSTGGTEALKEVLSRMPANAPAILMTQHMPESFTHSFAARLNSLSAMNVKEAENGERILPGHAYLAPGHSHLLVKKSGASYYCELSKTDPVNRHRPSVDVLFNSAAKTVGHNAIAALLTGMGKDGAAGMLAMRRAGAHTIAQNEATCVVYGMPRAAVELEAAEQIVALNDVAAAILKLLV
jgi:two-component system chemotaxis response regulator CheB